MNLNPGLLPLKLGIAQNKVNTWTFIQIYDITNLIDEFQTLRNQYVRIKTLFENEPNITKTYKEAFHTSYNLALSLEQKISSKLRQLDPTLNNKSKRGLINGLGSIIKSITGNLDQNDAEKYEKAIQTLTDNQNKMKVIMKDQISLLGKSIQVFEGTIRNLTHNQLLLAKKIDEIENLVQSMEVNTISTFHFFYIEMIISQIITEFQEIFSILEKIEIAITFSKLNTLHNSIVESNDLLNEIKSISEHLINNKLPFEPKTENILLFEKIMEIKSYSKPKQFVFIIEIPIVEKESYNYYHLYPLPVPKNNSFFMIIPYTKYLLINEHNYISFNEKTCKEIIPEEFICHETNPTRIAEDQLCEIQLLRFSKNLSNCRLVPVNISESKIQKIELDYWIIVIPDHLVAVQYCGNNRENIPLKGSYLLEINSNCEVRIKDNQIRNFKNNNFYFKNIILPKIDFEHEVYKNSMNLKPLQLNGINLNEISAVKSALEVEKQKLDFTNQSIRFDHINGWTIILYIILIIMVFSLAFKCYRKYCKPVKKETKSMEEHPLQELRLGQNSEINPRILH